MAEDIVGGLFGVNPEMYQQQQQQQVFNRAVALQNLSPFQQASVGMQQAGYNLAGALGGALGGVDPQLQRISALNAISKRIDQSNPDSMLQGAKMLADAGFTQEAFGLAQYARKANSELALAQQRMKEGRAAAIPKEVQIAEYVSTIKTQLGQLQAMEQTPDVVNAINLLQSRLDALPQPKEAAQNADIVKAQRAAQIVNQLAVLKGLPEAQQNPQAIRALETELAILNPTKEFAQNAKIVEAQRAAQITSQLAVLKGLPVDQQNPDAIRALETELAVLNPTKEAPQNADIVKAQRAGQIVNQLATLKGLPEAQQNPDAIRSLEAELAVLSPAKAVTQNADIAKAQRIGELVGQIDTLKSLPEAQQNPALIKQLNAQLSSLSGGSNKISNFAQQLIDRGFQPGSKDFNDRMDSYITKETTLPEKAAKASPGVGTDREAISKELYGKQFSELSQAEIKAVNAEADRRDLAAKKAGAAAIKVEVSSAQKQEGAFSTETGKLDAQVLADTRASAISAAQTLSSIASMKQLDKTGQLVTGPLANSYVGASNLLASIGLLSANQVSILTSSQVYDKSAKDLVMQDLGGKLGAQISDADRKFVEDRIPQLTTSAKARTELLDKIEQIQKGKVEYFKKMKAHANKYRNLDDFDFSEVYTVTPAAGSSAASATKAKADAIIKGTK
jgi:hypothetical protein